MHRSELEPNICNGKCVDDGAPGVSERVSQSDIESQCGWDGVGQPE